MQIYFNPLLPIFVGKEMNRDVLHLLQTIGKNTARLSPLLKIKDQLLDEMDKGILQKIPLIDVISTLMSLLVFPMLTRNMLTILFLEGNSQAFTEFYEQRRALVAKVMRILLTP